MKVYYNEFDKKKCAALKQLMIDGHISYGDIDDRPIQEVMPDDVRNYTRCHFFAGIGLWDYALDLARWEENRRVWTGSCPCQPFSSAGRQGGKSDSRHLWPEWLRLIEECKPSTIFGEQVKDAIAKGWLDDVYQGLEAQNYAVGSVVLPASSVGAPHRRERLWFVAHSKSANDRRNPREFQKEDEFKAQKRQERRVTKSGSTSIVGDGNMYRCEENRERIAETRDHGSIGNGGIMGDTELHGCVAEKESGEASSDAREGEERSEFAKQPSGTGASRNVSSTLADSNSQQSQREQPSSDTEGRIGQDLESPGLCSGARHWDEGVWIDCPDGKQRLVEPSIPLLAHGDTERVGLIHAAGDAIVPQVAAEFINAAK